MKYFFTLIACIIFISPLFSQHKRLFDLVKDFGGKADDRTDNYKAFSKAAAAISRNGGGVLNIPSGKYYIASYKITGGNKKNSITDIGFRNCTGLIIHGNNSIIRMNGKFSRTSDYRLPGLAFNYSYTNSVSPFLFTNCKEVVLMDITLYGEVDKMKRDPGVVESANHGVIILDEAVSDSSSNITLKNIKAHHFATDGFMVKCNGKHILLSKCYSYKNARQGLSIVKGFDIECRECEFDSTGMTGSYGSHNPGAGVDVECETGPGTLKDVRFVKCTFKGNIGFQIESTLPGENILIDSCFISDDTRGYSEGTKGVGMFSIGSTLSNCIIFGSIQVDIADQVYKGEKVQQIINNIVYSGQKGIICADVQRAVNVAGNIFIMLPHSNPLAYFPYIQSVNCSFTDNLVVVDPERVAADPGKYVSLIQGVKESVNDFWLMNNNTWGKELRKKNFYRVSFDYAKKVRSQFFPDNDITLALGSDYKKILSAVESAALLSEGLFNSFHQVSYNKIFLMQADEVHRYASKIIARSK